MNHMKKFIIQLLNMVHGYDFLSGSIPAITLAAYERIDPL